ncbi:MAG TPA: glutamine amidotransferase [Methylomirabilota bacterium]|nr:glutamine amidotransferase [Methylomirabilota bacterium]
MFEATVVFSGRGWLLPAAAFVVVSLVLLFWGYRAAAVSPGVRAACFGLKLLGLLALAACLLEPLWSGQRARPGANFFAVLADNSQGLQIKDRGDLATRGDALRDLVTGAKAKWPAALEENFRVRRYVFDTRLQSTRDFSELSFQGRATALATALKGLAERFQGQPLAGVLLFTDGNATDTPTGVIDTAGLPPIYPVVIGRDEAIKDIAIVKASVSQTAFEDAPVTVQAEVSAVGYGGATVQAQLVAIGQSARAATNVSQFSTNAPTPVATPPSRGASNSLVIVQERVVAEQTLRAARDPDTLSFRFQVRPERGGISFYRLRVGAKDETAQFTDATRTVEATLANNSRVLTVDRGEGPYRVLYVSGRPNWEFKFLNRAVQDDDQVEMAALIRIAKREPKFEFKGRAGESSNPLFRGFDKKTEETERYDQPVLVRLYTRDEHELKGGFPKTPEDLFAYHAVIVDDLEADFFTHDQKMLLQRFVSERGGGFLMLGGQESLQEGGYGRTPIGDMLPVYLDRPVDGAPPADLKLTLTREGWLQPWARLRSTEADERARLEAMPPFQVLNRVREPKPGASVIATVTDAQGNKHSAVVVQRYGHGRTAVVTVGDIWRWGLGDEQRQRDMAKAWRQLVRWLVADVPGRITLEVAPEPGDSNQSMALKVRARDREFQPLDNATVQITVQPVGTAAKTNNAAAVRMPAEPTLKEAGGYQATFVPRDTGGYLAQAVVTDASGVEVGRTEAGWASDPAAEEFRSLKPNRALLENLAQRTGGEVIAATKLDDFVRRLPERKAPITESWTSPLWHQAGVFLFALACFVAEWGLRRWKGLA